MQQVCDKADYQSQIKSTKCAITLQQSASHSNRRKQLKSGFMISMLVVRK